MRNKFKTYSFFIYYYRVSKTQLGGMFMENKYNIMISYAGDGDFKFNVRRIGEILISRGKPVYIYNVTFDVINDLRTFKRLLLNVNIGAKPNGAFRIYDYDNYTNMPKAVVGVKPNVVEKEPVSESEISSILKGGSVAPIIDAVVEEDDATQLIKDEIENTKDEVKKEVKEETPKKPVSTKKKTASKKKTSKKK